MALTRLARELTHYARASTIDRGFYRKTSTEQNGSIESLANRANAIRPYDIFRFRSQSKQTVMQLLPFVLHIVL